MGIEIILKIGVIGILTAVVNTILTNCGKSEICTFTTLSSLIIVLLMVVDLVVKLFDTIKGLFNLY